jgi:hypothetical protein
MRHLGSTLAPGLRIAHPLYPIEGFQMIHHSRASRFCDRWLRAGSFKVAHLSLRGRRGRAVAKVHAETCLATSGVTDSSFVHKCRVRSPRPAPAERLSAGILICQSNRRRLAGTILKRRLGRSNPGDIILFSSRKTASSSGGYCD